MKYNKTFFEQQRKSNISSAKTIVPIVCELLERFNAISTHTVIDLGCATGNWLSVFKENGWSVKGVDGGKISEDLLMIDKEEFVLHDFSTKYIDNMKYSIAMSLECAEHISEEAGDSLIDTLTQLSNIILFSAAIPHQRGKHHINEQYQSYWISKFEKRGFQVLDVIRPRVWNCESVRGFYAQNIFMYVKKDTEEYEKLSGLLNENVPEMYNIIHPETWENVNRFLPVRVMDAMHDNKVISWLYYTFIKRE